MSSSLSDTQSSGALEILTGSETPLSTGSIRMLGSGDVIVGPRSSAMEGACVIIRAGDSTEKGGSISFRGGHSEAASSSGSVIIQSCSLIMIVLLTCCIPIRQRRRFCAGGCSKKPQDSLSWIVDSYKLQNCNAIANRSIGNISYYRL